MRRNPALVLAGGLLFALLVSRAEARRARSLEVSISPTRQKAELELILAEVRAAGAARQRPVVVLDIDDTLIDAGKGGFDPYGPPIRGAIKFTKALLRAGARVVYLTGRRTNERKRTVAQLRKNGFPLGGRA